MSNDPKPQDPRRFYDQSVSAKLKDADTVRVTVKLDYQTWCCNGPHEIADAVKALDYVLQTIETTNWTPQLRKEAKELAEAKGFTVTDEDEIDDAPINADNIRAYYKGVARGHEEIQQALLSVITNDNHPIWESGNLQESLIRLVEGALYYGK